MAGVSQILWGSENQFPVRPYAHLRGIFISGIMVCDFGFPLMQRIVRDKLRMGTSRPGRAVASMIEHTADKVGTKLAKTTTNGTRDCRLRFGSPLTLGS
jgi:hypothetical protein